MTEGEKFELAGDKADDLIALEIERQDKMWGVANERADSMKGQLLQAAVASIMAVGLVKEGLPRDEAFFAAQNGYYPRDWSGFRDYGSDVANLVVASAFLRQEIKRRIALGEDTTRTSRNPQTQPYTGNQPSEYTK